MDWFELKYNICRAENWWFGLPDWEPISFRKAVCSENCCLHSGVFEGNASSRPSAGHRRNQVWSFHWYWTRTKQQTIVIKKFTFKSLIKRFFSSVRSATTFYGAHIHSTARDSYIRAWFTQVLLGRQMTVCAYFVPQRIVHWVACIDFRIWHKIFRAIHFSWR